MGNNKRTKREPKELVEWHKQVAELTKSDTERFQMEEALRIAAQEWRTTFDGISDAVCMLDRDGRIIRCNKAVANFLGRPFNAIIGYNCHELLHAKLEPIEECPIIRMRESHHREIVVLQITNRWFNVSVDPLFDKVGNLIGAVHIMTDITERKQTEEDLQTEKAYLEQLFETDLEAIIMTDNDGKIMRANNAFLRLFGYTHDEVIGQLVDELIAPGELFKEATSITKNVAEGKRLALEAMRQHKDGTLINVSILASPIIVGAKQVAVYGIYLNITERKKAEDALRQSEEEFRGLFKNASIGIYRTTPNGKILMANPTLVQLLGYSSFEELAQYNLEKDVYHPEYERLEFKKRLEREGKVVGLESIWKRKDGKHLYIRESARAVFDEKGRSLYYEGMVEDITQRKQVEEELKQNFEKLQKAIEGTIYAMARIVETRDPYTAGHQQRVATLALAIAKEMNLTNEQIMALRMSAVIHDIGKIYVPAEILSRPSKLSDTEFALIKIHPKVGYEILKSIEFPWPVADIVLQHHERLNGSGYPQGLKDRDIILEAKILTVADVVEAMSSHRPYRPARSLNETLDEIFKNKGVLYDSQIVNACLKLIKEKGFKFA